MTKRTAFCNCRLREGVEQGKKRGIFDSFRMSSVLEVYIKVIQDMYDNDVTVVKTFIGTTEKFSFKVELHQGSAIVMNRLTDGILEMSH